MKIYWKYQWNHKDFDIYERDTKAKTERHVYNSDGIFSDIREKPYSYHSDSIKRERQEYDFGVKISKISKADVLLEMI